MVSNKSSSNVETQKKPVSRKTKTTKAVVEPKVSEPVPEPVSEEPKIEPVEETKAPSPSKGGDAKNKRSFTIVSVIKDGNTKACEGIIGGRFLSSTPSGASRKSASSAARKMGVEECELEIHIKETTKGSTKKIYRYNAVRSLASEKGVDFKTNSGEKVQVPFKYTMKLKSLKSTPSVPEETTVAA